MSQPDLPKLPPPAKARPVLSRIRRRLQSKWWFDQMRREVDKAPEPKPDTNYEKTENQTTG